MYQGIPTSEKISRILALEGDAAVVDDLRRQLVKLGYQLAGHAAPTERAIWLVEELQPDLVLIDVDQLSPAVATATAQAIREQFAVPVVFLTSLVADDVAGHPRFPDPFAYVHKPFSERELQTVIAMAFYKHRAQAVLTETTEQLRGLSRQVLAAQEEERRRLALELHDELGQALTAIKINLQAQGRFTGQSPAELNVENIRIVDEALQQVRGLALALRPAMLDDLGLAAALHWIAGQTSARSGFSVKFRAERMAVRLAPEIETACYRIVQEALTNIARHAQATAVNIDLESDGDDLVLRVKDDGCGFDVVAVNVRTAGGGSVGMLGMRERATLLGGRLDIESMPGQGCTVRMRCPLQVRAEEK